MADENSSDKENRTEEATPQRLEQAREKGQVPRSRDLAGALTLMAGVLTLMVLGPRLGAALSLVATDAFGGLHRYREMLGVVTPALYSLGGVMLPFFVATTVAAMAAAMAQSGSPPEDWLKLDLTRLNPLPRLVQMFKPQMGGWEFAKTGLKLVGLSYGAYKILYPVWLEMGAGATLAPLPLIGKVVTLSTRLFLWLGTLLFVLAVADYGMARLRLGRDLRMSKQEIREEMKNTEGDPQIKRRMRRKAREILKRRLHVDVPRADVVVVNPTHYAVALSYKSARMRAPQVTAKGVDHLALRIRELARGASIPVVSSPVLARELYKRVPVGKEVPGELYRAVAEVLAFVYRIKNRAHGAGPDQVAQRASAAVRVQASPASSAQRPE